jgi:hypothetical protein
LVKPDGSAIDDDEGISAVLTVTRGSAESAVGIDVLKGFKQGLITTREGPHLVIGHVILRDYPIFIRLIA